ncbi:MAG TPA: sulfotransferase [Streptosporangiaceae bacterium]|nr:sulfotransferase [Streptosporangiaceae bacterium]
MRVIGVGLNRTGTTSLAFALEELGFGPCYHLRTLNSEPHRAADWIAAEEDPALIDWERVFQGFESAVGSPASAFWREITDAFRSAKVILTVRPADGWYESVEVTIAEALAPPPAAPQSAAPQPAALQPPTAQQLSHEDALAQANDEFQERIWEREIGGDFSDRDRTIEAFDKHIADVRAHVPADRLLVYSVREGWGPLCAFLGVPDPQRPFPRENDRSTFRHRVGLP